MSSSIICNWLNWREIAKLTELAGPEIQGSTVERVIVPLRKHFPEGYLKGEWAIRTRDSSFVFSVRPRHPYFYLAKGKGPQSSAEATRSAFDLALSKHIRGKKILGLEALPRERVVLLKIEGGVALVLSLIPATPEALLVNLKPKSEFWPIIARSRNIKDEKYHPPDGAKAPENLKIRDELFESSSSFSQAIEKYLDEEAFEISKRSIEGTIRSTLKEATTKIEQSETAIHEAGKEPDWQYFGDMLKAALDDIPPLLPDPETGGHIRYVTDFAADKKVPIPCDPKLHAQAQVEKFYSLAKRKKRRLEESGSRLKRFKEIQSKLSVIKSLLKTEYSPEAWDSVEKLKTELSKAGITGIKSNSTEAPSLGPKIRGWDGKLFHSKDGLPILVGRSKDENLELTFKNARGNDIWMHLRGRPGAHVLIPLTSGKTAPLETLLDAATLTLYYSGGKDWGKTEVDYTFKKYVKRIKDSTEASYTHNKTLIIEIDLDRLKRLVHE